MTKIPPKSSDLFTFHSQNNVLCKSFITDISHAFKCFSIAVVDVVYI